MVKGLQPARDLRGFFDQTRFGSTERCAARHFDVAELLKTGESPGKKAVDFDSPPCKMKMLTVITVKTMKKK
jgi:hypothetical protein